MEGANDGIFPIMKAWNTRDGNYGEKEISINPNCEFKLIEDCKLNKNFKEIDCTKLVYPNGDFITVLGTKDDFIELCRKYKKAVGLIKDLLDAGMTIKSFLLQFESIKEI